jgi:hypothetical protein
MIALLLVSVAIPALSQAQSVPPWRLSADPVMTLGEGTPQGLEFAGIAGVRLRKDGSVLVSSQKPIELRLYSSQGALIRKIAGEGDGPGEFRAPWVIAVEDTIIVFDFIQRRLTFLADGKVIPGPSMPVPSGQDPGYLLDRSSCGAWIAQPLRRVSTMAGPPGKSFRDTISTLVVAPTLDRILYHLGPFPGTAYLPLQGPMRGVTSVMFGPMTLVGAAGGVVYAMDTETPEIRRWSCDGRALSSVILPIPERPVERELVERLRRRAASQSSPLPGAALEERFAPANIPRHLPRVRSLVAGPNGEIWAEQYDGDVREPSTWWIIGTDGRINARIRMVPGFRLSSVLEDRVAGVFRDQDDVESVRVYRILK